MWNHTCRNKVIILDKNTSCDSFAKQTFLSVLKEKLRRKLSFPWKSKLHINKIRKMSKDTWRAKIFRPQLTHSCNIIMSLCNFNKRTRHPSRAVTDPNNVSLDQLYSPYLVRVIIEPLAIHVPGQLSRRPWAECHAVDVVFPIRAEGRVFVAEYHHAQGPHWNTRRIEVDYKSGPRE